MLVEFAQRGPHLRQPEIEHLHARSRHQDVRGLQVAMHDAMLVGSGHGLGDLDRLVHRLAPGHGRREWLALDVLHDQVGRVAIVADVVEGADVRVVERGDRACLALEATRVARR